MDKLSLIRKAISVAGKCTNCNNVAGVLKIVSVEFVPDVIDFAHEQAILMKAKKQEQLDAMDREEWQPEMSN